MEFQFIVASASSEAAAHRRARPQRKLRDETLTQIKANVVDFMKIFFPTSRLRKHAQ